MSSWFIKLNIFLLFSTSFIQTHVRVNSKRRYPLPLSSNSLDDKSPVYKSDDDSLIEASKIKTHNQANDEQVAQFTRLLIDRLNLKEPPNVTFNNQDGTGIPSIVKFEKENIQHNEEIHSHQREKVVEDIQATTERAILPGNIISHYTCQKQLAAKLNINKENLHHIDCFRFTKSSVDSKSLPTNQLIKQLRIYVKKSYFYFNIPNDQEHVYKPEMFQIYQVFRPASNDTLQSPLPGLTDTIRLTISQVKQLNRNWFELTVDTNNQIVNIQQIYKQFLIPWYGLAINHRLQSSWPAFYRRFFSKKHLESLLRSNEEDYSEQESQQLPYMLVEYGDKIPSPTSTRNTRNAVRTRLARPCDPKSPCCRRSLTIDLDQGNNALNFVIYPRQIDIGECIGLCGVSGSSLKYTDVKNAQHKNEPNAAYNLVLLHQNGLFYNRSTTTTQVNRPDQQAGHCCSYSRTGGLEIIYTTTNGGPIIRKFIPNIIVEECRCGLPATI